MTEIHYLRVLLFRCAVIQYVPVLSESQRSVQKCVYKMINRDKKDLLDAKLLT